VNNVKNIALLLLLCCCFQVIAAEPDKTMLFYVDRPFHWDVLYRVNQRDAMINNLKWHDRGFILQDKAVKSLRKDPNAYAIK